MWLFDICYILPNQQIFRKYIIFSLLTKCLRGSDFPFWQQFGKLGKVSELFCRSATWPDILRNVIVSECVTFHKINKIFVNTAELPYNRGGQPFSVCVPKSAKSVTKFFRVPTKICENIPLDILKGVCEEPWRNDTNSPKQWKHNITKFTFIHLENNAQTKTMLCLLQKWKSDSWMYTTRHLDRAWLMNARPPKRLA